MDAWITEERTALVTDLYQLTMLQAYWHEGMTGEATFDLFVRRLPDHRNYLLFCGLESALDYLEQFRFTEADLAYLGTLPQFRAGFLDWLRDFRFTGSVRAIAEGSVVFPTEPLMQVTAPIAEAQLAETFLLNQVTSQTVIGTKAARVVRAAQGRPVADFGMRRAHGTDAAVKGARAMHIAGVGATSNVAAGHAFGLPVTGTMAHAYIEAHEDERSALEAFAELYPETTLLVDTYDTLEGVGRVIEMAEAMGDGFRVGAIRLDSGDLVELAREARRRLDASGLGDVKLIASSSLDEYRLTELIAAGAPIDAFGVGTRLATSEDSPTIDSVYKLSAYDGAPRMKLAEEKTTLPGRKQVVRFISESGRLVHDVIGMEGEDLPGEPLLRTVMTNGARTGAGRESLETLRARAARHLDALPERLHDLERTVVPYPVRLSEAMRKHRDRVRKNLRETHGLDGPRAEKRAGA